MPYISFPVSIIVETSFNEKNFPPIFGAGIHRFVIGHTGMLPAGGSFREAPLFTVEAGYSPLKRLSVLTK